MQEENEEFRISEDEFVQQLVIHQAALRAYARRMVPDWALVDEAMQEASVVMWQKRSELRSLDGFLPWARVVLRYKCLRQTQVLRQHRPVFGDDLLQLLAEQPVRAGSERLSDHMNFLQQCLRLFSVEQRELLLAPHSEQSSVVSLAEQRRKSVNALYKLLGRLRQRLSDCLRRRISMEIT